MCVCIYVYELQKKRIYDNNDTAQGKNRLAYWKKMKLREKYIKFFYLSEV